MSTWRNWSGKLTAQPERIHHVRSEEDAAALAAHASASRVGIRPAGSSHSHSPLLPTTGILVDTSGLTGVASVDHDTKQAWVWAGTPIHALGRPLHDAGLALVNQGDIDRQTIAGAIGTGTHGTGATLTNMSAAVTAARLAVTSGEVLLCSEDERPDLWRAAQLNLGALGIVTQVQLQLRPAYRLTERGWTEPIEEMLPQLDDIVHQSRHFEFFWFPVSGAVVAKATDETDEPAHYPLAGEGQRCAWSYEVLANHRDWPHTEMEYSIPLRQGPACLAAIRELLARDFPEMAYPVEYRTVAADDVWLSPANGRDTVTISMHMDVREDDHDLFAACEEVFVSFDGRPHWGKVHHRGGEHLAPQYPMWDRWWRVRDEVDPTETFVNDHLRRLRHPASAAGSNP